MAKSSISSEFASLPSELRGKLDRCEGILREFARPAVAFSGGVDSTFLLALAARTLGPDNVLAVHAVGRIFPAWERAEARELAERLGVRLLEIRTAQMEDPDFTANPAARCYFCKKLLYSHLKRLAEERNLDAILAGTNADDPGDHRPGLRAEEELGIRRPLLETGLSKPDIRAAARALGLPTWNKPSCACLATRIPYGRAITAETLQRIERAETLLHELGFAACRVREHDNIARVEVPAEQIERAGALRNRIIGPLKALGYTYVTLDLEGFRSGSMNEAL